MLLWPFNKYPGTDYETFNWEWILKTVKEWVATMQTFKNDITAAWNAMRANWQEFKTSMTDDWQDYQDNLNGQWQGYQDNLNGQWQGYQDNLNDQWQEFIDDTYKDQITEILEDHPEWVTTVMDGAITEPKINGNFLKEIANYWVTPQMFGAVADGVTDDYTAFVSAVNDGRPVIVPAGEYYLSQSLKLPVDTDFKGADRYDTILKFADGVNGIQINARNCVENLTINYSGNASGLYVYVPEVNDTNMDCLCNNITLDHRSSSTNGNGIHICTESSASRNGIYNLRFSNIDMPTRVQYGIHLQANVKTNAFNEAWMSQVTFNDIFINASVIAILSDWNDISGTNAVPVTGNASRFWSIKFTNVAAQCRTEYSTAFCKIMNIRYAAFENCTPFDYYQIVRTHKPFVVNATADMTLVNFGMMPEITDDLNQWFEFINQTDFTEDFDKIIQYVGILTANKIYGYFVNQCRKDVGAAGQGVFTLTDPENNSIIEATNTIYGNEVVTVNLQIRVASLAAGSNDIGRLLPSPNTTLCPIVSIGAISQAGTFARAVINTNGYMSVICNEAINSASTIRCTFTYIRKYSKV